MKLTIEQLKSILQNPRIDHRGKNIYAICPWCGHEEFSVSIEDNHLFGCFRKKSCGQVGSIFTLLKKLGRSKEFIQEKDNSPLQKFVKIEDVNKLKIELDLSLLEINPPTLWKRFKDDPYLRNRGFEDYQFDKFEIGRSMLKKDYITFLVRQEGKLVGYVSRSDKKKEWIDAYNKKQKDAGSNLVYLRYDNSETDFAKTLFGIDEVIKDKTTTVILTEGILSKTKTDLNLGLDFQDEVKCCATFGSKLSLEQIQLLKLKNVQNIIFWFEADVLKKIKKIVTDVSLHFKVKASYLKEKDPNDIDSEEAFELLDNAKDWFNFNMSYVQ